MFGQAAGYTAVRSNATYVAISGGTNICTGTGCNGLAPSTLSLPWSFNFNGTVYNAIFVSENGFITFGGTAPTNANVTPISNATVQGVGAVAVWGFNNATTGSGRIVRYKNNGTSFSIEWVRAGNGSNLGGTHLDAQITLYQTTNVIEFTYRGPGSYPVIGSIAAQVGMRGATNTDYRNLTTLITAPGYGGVNTATAPYNSSTYSSVNNTKITWTPPSFCSKPSATASLFGSANLQADQGDISFTRGNGTGGVLVVARLSSTTAVKPSDGNAYTSPGASAAFNSGQSTTGAGNYIVYNGPANGAGNAITPLTITGLQPAKTYSFDIYEYNSSGVCYINTAYTGSFTTVSCAPTTQASGLNFTCYEYDKIGINFNRGNGSHVLVLAKAGAAVDGSPAYNASYTADVNFGSGS